MRLVFFIIFLLLRPLCADWSMAPSPTKRALHAVAFSSKSVGFIAGDTGTILKTVDGGASWVESASGIPKTNLTAISFFDPLKGVVAGDTGLVGVTGDGGITWTVIRLPGKPNFSTVKMIDAMTGFVGGGDSLRMGTGSSIFKTQDGGKSWSPMAVDFLSKPQEDIIKILFPSKDTGYAICHSSILRSTDGGSHWRFQSAGPGAVYLEGGFFMSPSAGVLVGSYYSNISKTQDGARTLRTVATWPTRAVQFPTPSTGFAVGNLEDIYKSVDQGETWEKQSTGITGTSIGLYDVCFTDSENGIAVGDSGTIFRSTASSAGLKLPGGSRSKKKSELRNREVPDYLINGRKAGRSVKAFHTRVIP